MGVLDILGSQSSPPNPRSITCSFKQDSAYSLSASESATIPQPAKSVALLPSTSAERNATTNSPSPLAPIQPIGPAYQPRSSFSLARITSSASRRGKPPTAG